MIPTRTHYKTFRLDPESLEETLAMKPTSPENSKPV